MITMPVMPLIQMTFITAMMRMVTMFGMCGVRRFEHVHAARRAKHRSDSDRAQHDKQQ